MSNLFSPINLTAIINENKSKERAISSNLLIAYHHILKWCYVRSNQTTKWVHESILEPINDIVKDKEANKKSNLNKFDSETLYEIYSLAKKDAAKDNTENGNKSESQDILEDKYNIFQYVNTIDKILDYRTVYNLLLKFCNDGNKTGLYYYFSKYIH